MLVLDIALVQLILVDRGVAFICAHLQQQGGGAHLAGRLAFVQF